jgi:hypothetical protein
MKIHVAIVSEQILANLIPALMERPDKVYLIASADMSQRKLDKRLARLLERDGIGVERCENAPSVGMNGIHAYASRLRDDIVDRHADAEIVLNATGGTKPMSLGFVEVFRGIASRIIYTDTLHRQIESLPNADAPIAQPAPMRDVLDVPRYLAAQGLTFSGAASDSAALRERMQARKAAAKSLARNAPGLESFIRTMNALADKALDRDGNLIAPVQSLNYPPHPKSPWADAMRELVNAKCFGWKEGECDVVFIDAERTQFVRGGWLEEYAFHIVHDEKPFDARMGVDVQIEGGELATNEFDVLACHGNQLLFVECKTLKFEEGRNDNDLAYKLKSLGETARGLFGETWLLSAQSPTPMLVERARQARIRLLGPADLPNLRDIVRQWMEPKR